MSGWAAWEKGECDILIAGRSDGSIVLWRLSESNKTAGRGGTSREYRDELLGGASD